MQRFLIRRFFFAIFALVGATIIVFGLSRFQGDPRNVYFERGGYGMTPEQYELFGRQLGLDKPLVVQYFVWLGKVVRGDLGKSLLVNKPVASELRDRTPNTLRLALAGFILATAIGVPLGVVSAITRGSIVDKIARLIAVIGQSAPSFWIALMLIFFFAVKLRWLPTGTMGEGISIRHYILPAIALAGRATADYMRITRSAMLEVLDSEYIKFARSKGVAEWLVIWKHAFRNALIPPLTMSALILATFVTGHVALEIVFSWPGLGRLAVEAVWETDFALLTGSVLVFAAIFIVLNFVADVSYGLIDPRIRYT